MLRRALAFQETKLGKDHPDLVPILSSLSIALAKQNDALRFRESQLFSWRFEEIRKKNSEEESLSSRGNWRLRSCVGAGRSELSGKIRRGQGALSVALTIRECRLGKDHPDAISTRNTLNFLSEIMKITELP